MSFKKDVDGVKYVKVPKQVQDKLYKKYGSWVQINRRRYDLVFCSEISLVDTPNHPAGLCDPHSKALFILVTPEMDDEYIQSTIIHEIGHAEMHEGSFHQRNDWCRNNEEQVVDTFGESISYNYEIRRRKTPPSLK